jgi:hypothetical protein
MVNTKCRFLLDEIGFLSNEDIEHRYDYFTLKYTQNLENIRSFIEEQFRTQGL